MPSPLQPTALARGSASRGAKRSRSTPQSTTSVFPRASGTAVLEPLAQPARDRDHASRRDGRRIGSPRDARDRADVRDVLAVRGDDERRARRERGGEAGGNEEVRVGDVGMEARAARARVADEREVAASAATSRVDDGPLDLVAARDELALEVRDEDPEVRVVRPRVHLRDEEDPQGATRA